MKPQLILLSLVLVSTLPAAGAISFSTGPAPLASASPNFGTVPDSDLHFDSIAERSFIYSGSAAFSPNAQGAGSFFVAVNGTFDPMPVSGYSYQGSYDFQVAYEGEGTLTIEVQIVGFHNFGGNLVPTPLMAYSESFTGPVDTEVDGDWEWGGTYPEFRTFIHLQLADGQADDLVSLFIPNNGVTFSIIPEPSPLALIVLTSTLSILFFVRRRNTAKTPHDVEQDAAANP